MHSSLALPRGAVCSVDLEGGDLEPAVRAQVAQVAVAHSVGKGQLVPVWQLHFESVILEGHGELQWEGRVSGRREALETGLNSASMCLGQDALPSGLFL